MINLLLPGFLHNATALRRGIVACWLLFFVVTAGVVRAQSTADTLIPARPNPPRLVNDYVGILQPGERAALEEKLRRYNDTTSTQITIVIVKTTGIYPIGDFAFQIGRKWGVGQKDKNNGLVLAWATQDRKIYIATGYGLEGALPDAVANRIIDETLRPAFQQEQYYRGLDAATTEIIKRAQGEYDAEPAAEGGSIWSTLVFMLIIFGVIWFFSRRGGGGNRYRGGGGFGGPIFFPTTFSGWGSSSGGSSSGGGGSDFGGFGGGSFGGGGAGGDY